ncbi:MAG: Transrane secretion effector [Jatrophihabitantaceae bacterium]|nr:Transrane secretion effector [Jatrophihabitantaceae bacterium]
MTEKVVVVRPIVKSSTSASDESRNPFTNANYRRWWTASIVAGTGVGIQTATVPLFIQATVAHDHRQLAVTAALICQNLPAAIFALFGGVIADRVERRRILVRTYAVAAAVSLAYVALTGFSIALYWPVLILGAVVGSAGAFTNPARSSMTQHILRPSQLPNGIILGTVAFMATLQVGGPSVGGLIADGLGLTWAFTAEVAMLALAALIFSRVPTDTPAPTGKNVWGDLKAGLAYVRESPVLRGILVLGTIPGVFFMGPFTVTNLFVVKDVLHESDKFVGIMFGCLGAGILVGSVMLTVLKTNRRGVMLIGCMIGGGGTFAVYGQSSSLPLSMLILFLSGIVGPAIFINFAQALLQLNTDRPMMGRVMSMYGLSFAASVPLGQLQGGILMKLIGPQATITISGTIMASIGVVAMFAMKRIRELR